jgi:hypothetical protein
MEYLTTYGWAILVMSIVFVALFSLGVFSPPVTTLCIFPAGLACQNVFMVTNGVLTINLLQVTSGSINVTAIGCNSNNTIAHMQIPFNPPSNQIKLQIASNYTFNVQCYAGSTAFSASPGAAFNGYVIVNYTDTVTGFPRVTSGQLRIAVQ